MKLFNFFKKSKKEDDLTSLLIAIQRQYMDSMNAIKKLELEIEKYEKENNARLIKLESRVKNFTA
jgi:hypothetical protein